MILCESKHAGMIPDDDPLWIETCRNVPCVGKFDWLVTDVGDTVERVCLLLLLGGARTRHK